MLPLEDFFRLSERTAYQLSPDGKHISFLAPYEEKLNIFVQHIDSEARLGEPMRVTAETERSIAGYMWADNERILFVKDTAGDENFHLYGVRTDGTDLRSYINTPNVRVAILDELEEVPNCILVETNQRNAEVFDPYRLNLETGELTMLAENPGNYQGWTTDHNGCLRVVYAIVDGVNTQILYRDAENEDFRPVLTTNFREKVSYLLFAPDNKSVYALSNLGRDKEALVKLDPATAQEQELLFEHPRYDVASLSYSRRNKKLLSAYCTGHKTPVRHFFDPQAEALRQRIDALFPEQAVSIADTDKAEEHYLLFVGSDKTRGAYYHYTPATDRLVHIADTAPWIKPQDMVEMNAISFQTSDGLHIEAYLSLPKGAKLAHNQVGNIAIAPAQPLPLIVNPHGGPWARNVWGYNSETQFLCSRGYAVLQLNFRGSTGYGRQFLEASYKQWGLKMQDDITEAVQWLVGMGVADPQRIAIYGGSYGGYATLAGICFTPQLYRCAVDYVGVSNLLTFMNTIPPYWKPMIEMMHQQIGHPQTDRAQLEATSPALHAENIVCPLFVAQGANDPRVNKAESDQMVEALRKRGVEVEYMVKNDEGHGFQNQQNRFDFYRAMERFFKKHL